MKHLIIGGVAGGATAAARIRRSDEFAEIVMLEKGKYISYANCGLPYYIGGTITDRDELFVYDPTSFGDKFNADVRVENEAIAINTETKSVDIRRADGSVYTENYDKLLLAPGAFPVKPPLEGIDTEGIFTLRNVEDTDHIKTYITSHKIENAVIVGAGFIGMEMAENLHYAGAKISIVEINNQLTGPLDFSMAAHVHKYLLEKGVQLYLEQTVERFEKDGEKIKVFLKSGNVIVTDVVIVSVGVRPETTLAKAAGLKIGEAGGIWVDEYLQTSAKDVYAVGDAIEFPHPLTGKPWLNYLANPANRQGRIVADNMVFGNNIEYEGAIGTAIVKIFDMAAAFTGLTAKRLQQMNMEYTSSTIFTSSHAGYYPDALSLIIKITFDPKTGKLYGGQAVGYDGVDKRIDQIALLIKNGGTVYDLTKVEHAYAPPFSSVRDPITVAGYVASNIVCGAMPVVTWRQIQKADRNNILLLDVRTAEENSLGTVPGAVNIPLNELRLRIDELPEDKTKGIYVFCASGQRAYHALKILTGNGFKNVKNLSGGYKTYETATEPIVNKEITTSTENKTNANSQHMETQTTTIKVDASGLPCPGPIIKMKQTIDTIGEGERVEMTATDPGFHSDVEAWCNTTGNLLISNTEEKGKYTAVVEKSAPKDPKVITSHDGKAKTFIVFSDDLDKALAAFVLANGAAATGQKVSMFFTFWGLNVIKKVAKPKVKKDIFGKVFGMMLPSNSLKLHLSKMSIFGIGDKMMRYTMKQKNIYSLEELRQQALEQGVEFISCQMSMDVMGVKREELLDEVTVGGVATYMERAEGANVNLFI
ncbi:MAG: FAD-dependent oxidoreductase [Bacteroidetes bacterium]|nr:FAD-dependent oxidoreductase [Bacteroidota bacterium]MCL2302200.1 FAD-dependent oxidoreductase [Lentimicrobiaceae bacterium]MCL2302280.1 FAD-dependent oxidoreductase [Lentimicrobiaceae bacterium]